MGLFTEEEYTNLVPSSNIKKVRDKKILVGNEFLFKRRDWIPFSEMDNRRKIITHPLFDTAFDKIVKLHRPTHKIAFISLCTSTRPYDSSRKWGTFKQLFGSKCDLIVSSNAGLIPSEYWQSYPFLNYDGGHEAGNDEVYWKQNRKKLKLRLWRFFNSHNYDYIIANFRPKIKNIALIRKVLSKLKNDGKIKEFAIVPSDNLYRDIQDRGFPSGMIFPDLDEKVLEALHYHIQKFDSRSK